MNKILAMVLSCIMGTLLLVGCGAGKFIDAAAPANSDLYTEVLMQVGDEAKPLDAVLTMPKVAGKPPVVIMVQGSGPSDKDETIKENKPFLDIARGLAQKGIATLRFDKRTFTYPEDFAQNPTIQGEMLDDVKSAVSLMKTNKDVGDIYVLGHSLGGMLAPEIAQENPDVAGLIIMAGSPRGLEDIIYDQNLDAMEQMVMLPQRKEETKLQLAQMIDTIKNLKQGDTGEYFGVPASYWVSLNEIDTQKIAKELPIPILVMQGDADFQVSVKNDYAAWEELLQGKSNVVFKLYKNLNHLFMESNGKKDVTEYDTKSTVSSQAIDDIATFIKEQQKALQ